MREMPQQVARPYKKLVHETYSLQWKWQLYRALFGTSERRCKLLEAVASFSFLQIQFTILDDVTLSVSRLADDDARSLSLCNLHKRLAKHGSITLAAQVAPFFEEFAVKAADLETLRNKRIAHIDLATI